MIVTVSTTGAVLAGGETVQVNVSVSVSGAVADGDGDRVGAGRAVVSVPLMTPVAGVDRDAVGQAGGAVGQRVGVGVGGVGVEVGGVALTVSVRSARSVVNDGALLTTVTDAEVTGALSRCRR